MQYANQLANALLAVPAPASFGYGAAPMGAPSCLVSGRAVAGRGRAQFCIDINGSVADGQKLVVRAEAAQPSEAVRFGANTYVRAPNASEAALGPILEIKPFQQDCEVCDSCACIGCGERCACSCNALCRLRHEPACAHTAGVLTPGRWYVGVDAPGAFTLQATVVAAQALPPSGEWLTRTVVAGSGRRAATAGGAEGGAFADYFYFDPAVHESLTLQLELKRVGSAGSWVDVYVRFGEWPTTLTHDAAMSCDRAAHPLAQFALRADRLLNERLCVMVVGRGDGWAEYALAASTAPSAWAGSLLLGALLVVGLAVAAMLVLAMRQAALRGAPNYSDEEDDGKDPGPGGLQGVIAAGLAGKLMGGGAESVTRERQNRYAVD